MEEFYNMPPELRHLYIASDLVAAEDRKKIRQARA
jgi:hypothetical protein